MIKLLLLFLDNFDHRSLFGFEIWKLSPFCQNKVIFEYIFENF